ncbi:phage holin family protein [Thalassiella azotivora]
MTERTIGQLVADIQQDLTALVRHEIALAKSELKRDVTKGGAGAGLLAGAAFLGVVAFFILCFAGAYGLVAAGLDEWLAFLIVFAVLVVVAGVLALVGKKQLTKINPPERTIATSKDTVAALKGQGPVEASVARTGAQ